MLKHDELVAVRLEFAHVKDQRDAYKAALKQEIREIVAQVLHEELHKILGKDKP